MFRLGKSLGFQLNSAALAMRRELEKRLSSYSLNVPQWVVLGVLLDGELVLDELCSRLEWDRLSILNAVQSLESRGLVARRRHADSREQVVELTASGSVLMRRLPAFSDEVNAEALAGFGPQERELLVHLVARVCKNLAR